MNTGTAVRLVVYSPIRDAILSGKDEKSAISMSAAGFLAGATGYLTVTPFFQLKTRLQVDTGKFCKEKGVFLSEHIKRLKRHIDVVNDTGLENIVNSAVEGGVYDENGDLLKVTGGFAPLNQIIGAPYRDNEGIFPTFIEKYRDIEKNESKKYSLKSIFNLID